jgi:CRISPR-associated exonuclease Cas4
MNLEDINTHLRHRGTLVNYFFICKRKVWLFEHNIAFENQSEVVQVGALIGEGSYSRRKKEIGIDNKIVVDWIDFQNRVVHEVKKSDSYEEAHIWQLKYYLYYLEQKGLANFSGQLNYPKLHNRKSIRLTDEDRKRLNELMDEIDKILKRPSPPPAEKIGACNKCSYSEFCWVEEAM